MLECFQLLRNDILLPTALLLNQTWSVFQTHWSFFRIRKLTLWLYYNLLVLPKLIHFVNNMWYGQTDVLLLLLYFYSQICNNTIFHAITWGIAVGCANNALGNKKSKELLGVYAFTGCDLTGRFSGFSETIYFDTFFKSNWIVQKAFASLGNNDNNLKEEIIDGLTKFVLDLYHPKRPSNINTLRQLRWYLFLKFQYDPEKLPFTSSALHFAIYRSHLVCTTWKKSLFPAPSYLNPKQYGWEYDTNNNSYEAVMTDQLPAPKHIVELCIWKCKKGYESLQCRCKKNNLVCTKICLRNHQQGILGYIMMIAYLSLTLYNICFKCFVM